MLFILYRIGKFLTLHIPLKAGYWLANLVSSLYCFFSRNDRRAVQSNLKVLFPDYDEKRINNMAKEVFINFGKYLVDFFRFSKIDRDYIDKYVKLEGLENLEDALKEKKGVICVTAHLGSWELGGTVLSILGYPFNAVVLEHKDKQVNRFFIRQRQMKGWEVIPIGAALRRCFSALGDNQVLALVGDRDYYNNGLEIDFFGRPTIIPKGPAVFNRRCGSLIVPTFMIRNSDDTFTFKFYKPLRTRPTRSEHQDLIATTKEVARVLEEVIKQYPTQWYVFREFWRRISWVR